MFRIDILLTEADMFRMRSSQEDESTPKKRISQIALAENIPDSTGANESPAVALRGAHQVDNAHDDTSTIDEFPLGQRTPGRRARA